MHVMHGLVIRVRCCCVDGCLNTEDLAATVVRGAAHPALLPHNPGIPVAIGHLCPRHTS